MSGSDFYGGLGTRGRDVEDVGCGLLGRIVFRHAAARTSEQNFGGFWGYSLLCVCFKCVIGN